MWCMLNNSAMVKHKCLCWKCTQVEHGVLQMGWSRQCHISEEVFNTMLPDCGLQRLHSTTNVTINYVETTVKALANWNYRHLLSASDASWYTAGHVEAVGQLTVANHVTDDRQLLGTSRFLGRFKRAVSIWYNDDWLCSWPSNDQHVTATTCNLAACTVTIIDWTFVTCHKFHQIPSSNDSQHDWPN